MVTMKPCVHRQIQICTPDLASACYTLFPVVRTFWTTALSAERNHEARTQPTPLQATTPWGCLPSPTRSSFWLLSTYSHLNSSMSDWPFKYHLCLLNASRVQLVASKNPNNPNNLNPNPNPNPNQSTNTALPTCSLLQSISFDTMCWVSYRMKWRSIATKSKYERPT
jgi:hypothetical protein